MVTWRAAAAVLVGALTVSGCVSPFKILNGPEAPPVGRAVAQVVDAQHPAPGEAGAITSWVLKKGGSCVRSQESDAVATWTCHWYQAPLTHEADFTSTHAGELIAWDDRVYQYPAGPKGSSLTADAWATHVKEQTVFFAGLIAPGADTAAVGRQLSEGRWPRPGSYAKTERAEWFATPFTSNESSYTETGRFSVRTTGREVPSGAMPNAQPQVWDRSNLQQWCKDNGGNYYANDLKPRREDCYVKDGEAIANVAVFGPHVGSWQLFWSAEEKALAKASALGSPLFAKAIAWAEKQPVPSSAVTVIDGVEVQVRRGLSTDGRGGITLTLGHGT